MYREIALALALSIGVSGTAGSRGSAMARMVTAYPALESGLVVVRRSTYIFIQPFVESVLQSVDIPARALVADADDRALR